MFLTIVAVLTLAAPDFTAKDLHSLKRLADPQISPDGKWVLYQQTSIDLGKSRNTDLFIVPAGGGAPRALTSHPKSDSQGRFSKDGLQIAFLSSRDGAPHGDTRGGSGLCDESGCVGDSLSSSGS